MISIGIDPGLKGAWAAMCNGKVLCAHLLPFAGGELNIYQLASDIKQIIHRDYAVCVIEKVHAMPKQGVCSMFTFGKGYGELIGMIKTLAIPLIQPTPQEWKKCVLVGTDYKGNKAASIEYVTRRYPATCLTPGKKIKPSDGITDAVCLAEYAEKKGKRQ